MESNKDEVKPEEPIDTNIIEGEVDQEKKKKKKKKNKNKDKAEDEEHLDQLIEKTDKVTVEEEKKGGEENEEEGDQETGDKKKKKKRNKKKGTQYGPCEQDNSEIRLLGSWSASDTWKQSVDYSIPISKQFPDLGSGNHKYPEGEWMEHPSSTGKIPIDFNLGRSTAQECRARDNLHSSAVNDLRQAAECHRQTRKFT